MEPIAGQRFTFVARNNAIFEFCRILNPPLPPDIVKETNKKWAKEYGVKVRNTQNANEYNCHGLTFVGRLGWFETVREMLVAHKFVKIAECANFEIDNVNPFDGWSIKKGDIVLYYNGSPDIVTHTGVIWETRKTQNGVKLTILSKWGMGCEYFHRHDKVTPTYGKSIEVWTDRSVDD